MNQKEWEQAQKKHAFREKFVREQSEALQHALKSGIAMLNPVLEHQKEPVVLEKEVLRVIEEHWPHIFAAILDTGQRIGRDEL